MTEISCTAIKQSRYISRETIYSKVKDSDGYQDFVAKPEWSELAMAFKRNRIRLDFKVEGLSGNNYYSMPIEFESIKDKVSDYCDKNCSGFWTWNIDYRSLSEYDHTNQRHTNTDKGRIDMTVQFEKTEDIEPFLKNCAVLLRLAH